MIRSEEIEELVGKISNPVIRPGLSRIARLLSQMGHPERDFPAVHVVGTNGKGSIAAMLESIFLEAGYTTCLYTSPHLIDITERLRFSGAQVKPEDLYRPLEKAGALLEQEADPGQRPTYFEVLTAAAFDAIRSYSPDIAIIEAGMGGRLDATNILGKVLMTVISSVGTDHVQYLGGSILEIAMEKFRVLRPGGRSIFSGTPAELQESYLNYCKGIGNTGFLTCLSTDLRNICFSEKGNHFEISLKEAPYLRVHSHLGGVYQIENAATAILAGHELSLTFTSIDNDALIRGIDRARWPGRMERFALDGKQLILDGAHNVQGIRSVVDSIDVMGTRSDHGVVFAAMRDKDTDSMVETLCRAFPMVVFTSLPGNEICIDHLLLLKKAGIFSDRCNISVIRDPLEALFAVMKKYDRIICCGSLFLVGKIRKWLISGQKGESP